MNEQDVETIDEDEAISVRTRFTNDPMFYAIVNIADGVFGGGINIETALKTQRFIDRLDANGIRLTTTK